MGLVTGMSRMSRMSSKRTLKRRHIETSSLAQSTKSSMSKSTVRIKNDTDGNVTDVKDLKTVRFSESPSEESEFEEDMEFDSSGKLVVHDIDELPVDLANNMDDGDTISSFKSKRSASERSSLTRKKDSTKKKKASNNGEKLGSAYKSKKAGG